MERGRKGEMRRKKDVSICLLLLAVLHITMPALASGNCSSKMPKLMSLMTFCNDIKKKNCNSLLASQSLLQVRTPAPLQPQSNLHSVTSHGQQTSQQLWGILLCSSVAFRMALLTLPSPFMVVTATTAYSAHPDIWKTFPG